VAKMKDTNHQRIHRHLFCNYNFHDTFVEILQSQDNPEAMLEQLNDLLELLLFRPMLLRNSLTFGKSQILIQIFDQAEIDRFYALVLYIISLN
jgi:hypothetical protein